MAPTLYFDHRMTNRIKGIAIIMMMILHFFTVPQWYLPGISYPELSTFAKLYYQPFELCVPVFACLTGLFCGIRPSCDFRYAFRKITDLLIGYWLIYLLIIIVVLVLGTLWGLALCFAAAWILDWPIRFLIRQKNKLFLDTTVKSV